MIGALVGDIVGSVYEWHNIKTKEFELLSPKCFFTDDSVLTVALADSILTGTPYVKNLKAFAKRYPDAGYGGGFCRWVQSESFAPYNSFGNGAAMRISPVGYAFNDLDTVLAKAEEFTAVTHNHPEGIKGGQATAGAIFLARTGQSKDEIRAFAESRCDLVFRVEPSASVGLAFAISQIQTDCVQICRGEMEHLQDGTFRSGNPNREGCIVQDLHTPWVARKPRGQLFPAFAEQLYFGFSSQGLIF